MFFCLVVLLSLSWPHVIGTGNTHPRDEAAFDQIATASENVAQNAEKPEQKPEFRNQLITSMIDTTVHYENSNGFVPILVSSSPSPSDPFEQPDATSLRKEKESINVTWNNFLNERVNPANTDSTDEQTAPHETEDDNLEDDPVYSTEARIFLNFPNLSANRRSFEYQGDRNNFELLKVRNDTPVVATYTDLYDEALGINENGEEKTSSTLKHKTQGNPRQKVEDYMANYGTIVSENNSEDDSRSYYYSHNLAKDLGKKSRDQEKVDNNYQQQNVLSYDGHGQSAARQNEPAASSLPRLNDEVSVFLKTNAKNDGGSYNFAPSSPQVPKNHKFSHPVVVAESNYKFHQPSSISAFDTDNHQTSRIIDSVSSEVSHRYTMNNRDGRFRSDEDSRDASDEGDYAEYTERPRRVQKSRRRPSNSSKRLPKEHRGNLDSAEQESQGKRHHSSRSKSHRQKVRGNSWTDDDRHQDQDDSYEDARYDGRFSASEMRHVKSQKSNFKPSSSWNQISPNLEISHSSGIEIGQLEKPKLIVPVKVNLVPVANFDHATAIGNSQGFDVSNAILHNIVSATPLNAVSTSAPEISTGENVIGNDVKIRVSTPLPDIIVGQNNFHNSMHANLKPQYVSNTVAPVFAVTPSLNHNLQSISAQDAQGTATSRPAVVTTSNQMSANHMPQLILPQPTFQTISTLMQTPVIGSDYIQVNPHGIHGQNPISHGNLQAQPLPTMPTITPTPQTIPVTKINLITSESQNKKTMLPGTSTNFLASASFAVGHDDQGQTFNGNPYYLENSNSQGVKPQVQDSLYQQSLKNINVAPKTKTYLQTTHLLPAVFNPMPTFTTLSASTPQIFSEQQNIQGTNFLLQQSRDQGQQYLRQNTGFDNSASTLKNIKLPSLAYQMIDNTASHSTDNINTLNASPSVSGIIGNAHLPHVGARNVEIVNPNIKPNPIDTTIINSYESMNYPTAVLTTSIPMFSTTSFVTAKPAILSTTESTNVQNVMNAFTDVGSNNNQGIGNDLKAYQSQDKPMFNPINFVPNMDVVKNQNALNNKLHANEPLQQNLNLVPLLPGGNFFKPSFSAQSELLVKPKLTLDLKTYAEQMFKESLKTIYNSQKWNNDRKPGNNRNNATDLSDIAKLKNELQRLKASLFDSRQNKDQLEAHHSETKVRTTELSGKKPDEMIAALEQMLKKNPKNSLRSSYGNNKPYRQRRPQDQDKYNFGSNNDFKDTKHVRDFLTPPQLNSHRTKSHLRGKPGKKRPGPNRFNNHNHNHKHNHHHGPRSHSRSNLSHKSANIDSSGSNIDSVHTDGSPKHDNTQDSKQFRKGSPFDSHASPSTLSRDTINFPKASKQHKDGKENAYNHPKVHNFLGLLMKNKQLPNGATANYFRDKNQLNKFFENEKMRTQQQFYDDTLRDYYQKVTDGMLYSNLGQTDPSARRSLSEKRTV